MNEPPKPACQERLEWRKLVTPQLTRGRPIYGWFVYPHSYDKRLVDELLAEMAVRPGATVWDPFVGAGTTLLACIEHGMECCGTDLLPLSVLVSTAKVSNYDSDQLRSALAGFDDALDADAEDCFADVPVVRSALPQPVRVELSALRKRIEQLDPQTRPFFLTALVSIVERVSSAVKSGGWLRLDATRTPHEAEVKPLFIDRCRRMLADLDTTPTHHRTGARVWQADARTERLPTPVDAIITSPPYLNRHDYTRVFALELALVAVRDAQELKNLRYRALRSHVEARAPTHAIHGYREPRALAECIAAVTARGANDPRVPRMIRGYFEDMFGVLSNLRENLAPGGSAALVIGDVRFSGIMIPVTELLVQLGGGLGLVPKGVIVARYRGNSSQQMGAYGRERAKESVVIFRRQ